jgi:hypothetical protein
VGLNPTGITAVESLQIKVCGDFRQKGGEVVFGRNFHFQADKFPSDFRQFSVGV